MGPRVMSWSWFPVDRHSKMKTIAGGRSWAMPRERLHIPHSGGLEHLPNYACTERLFRGQRVGYHPLIGDVNIPIGLFTRIHFGEEMWCVHTH